jgi:site-specific recombinase XerD
MVSLISAHEQFINYLKNQKRASATILAYGKDIEQLVTFLKEKGLEEPTQVATDQLQAFMDKLNKEHYTPKSISRKTNSTKTFFRFLKQSGQIEADPAQALEHPQFEIKPPRILSKLEYRALRDAARGDIRMSAIIEFLLQSGVRIGELSKIATSDLNLEGSSQRTIPLNRAVLEALKKYLEIRPKSQDRTLFITKTGRPLLIRNIRTAIDRYFRLAGIKGAKVNDLRHTWVTHQLACGLSLSLVSKLAGHKRVSTTEKYLQFVPQRGTEDKIKLEEL